MDALLAGMAESGENDASALHPSRALEGSTPPRPIKRCGLGINFPGTIILDFSRIVAGTLRSHSFISNTHTHPSAQTMPKRTR
jgi:hypothetical protein